MITVANTQPSPRLGNFDSSAGQENGRIGTRYLLTGTASVILTTNIDHYSPDDRRSLHSALAVGLMGRVPHARHSDAVGLTEREDLMIDWPIQKAVETVLDTFRKAEAAGYRSRDRQYAISILGKCMEVNNAAGYKWEEFSGLTPIDKPIMLWFVGDNAPKAAHACCIGQVSSHEPGKVWDGTSYRPIEWFSRWRLLPPGPDL